MADFSNRAYPRFEVNAFIDVSSDGMDDVMLFHQIENISMGGIQFSVPEQVETGTQIDLAVNFPDTDETINVVGEVVWCREGSPVVLGVRFQSLEGESRDVLRRYLNRVKERHERDVN